MSINAFVIPHINMPRTTTGVGGKDDAEAEDSMRIVDAETIVAAPVRILKRSFADDKIELLSFIGSASIW